jgi:predicted nucleotidyltransferase component of viral defense system
VITFFEENRNTQVRGHGAKALYRFTTEYEEERRRVKLEINCKEHFKVMDWVDFPFEVDSDWFRGSAQIKTYNINELLGTKLRALYQRSKGRDLFDLDYSRLHKDLDIDSMIKCFNKYMEFSLGEAPSQKEFLLNIEAKENDPSFFGDMEALLRPPLTYNQGEAFKWLKKEIISKI